MADSVASLKAQYSGRTDEDGMAIAERISCCVAKTSLEFDQWDDPHAQGPGLYFVVERTSATACAQPMGSNRWPVENCASAFGSLDALTETAETVAFACDGAVVVHNDGTIQEEMVRMKQLSTAARERIDGLPYEDWMGARHMSALETSTREEIAAVITLSEEDGRMTIFIDGAFEDYPRDVVDAERRIED